MKYKVKEARKNAKLSQEELSAKANVSRAVLSSLENNMEVSTSTATLCKIAAALNVKVSDIFLD